MKQYVLVEEGQVKSVPRRLPRSWRNISGLHLLDDAKLAELGWLPVLLVDLGGDVHEDTTYEVGADSVTATKIYRAFSPQEIADQEAAQAARIKQAARDLISTHIPIEDQVTMIRRGVSLERKDRRGQANAAEQAEILQLETVSQWADDVHSEAKRLIDGKLTLADAAWPTVPGGL